MNFRTVRFTLDEGAYIPVRAHPNDAGLDLRTPAAITIPAAHSVYTRYGWVCELGSAVINTGVHVAIPEGYYGRIEGKSGLNFEHGINPGSGGTIDCGYTGAIMVKLYNYSTEDYHFKKGDKIAQLVICPYLPVMMDEVTSLGKTARGNHGFGSSGR